MTTTDKKLWIEQNLKTGESYGGVLLGLDGQPDQHIILLPGEAESVTWDAAQKFAKKSGGELPTRREQSLLFANTKGEFQQRWYWSGEQRANGSDYAWVQYFDGGNQDYGLKSRQGRARAVRRLIIL